MGVPTQSDRSRCACARCPTFSEGDAGLFCLAGKREKDSDPRGCLCRTCPVHVEHQLGGREYCLRGTPEEQE